MLDEENSVLSALRREPEQTALLLKLTAVMAVVLVAWDVGAALVLPTVAVTAVLVLLLLTYGAAMTYMVARIMSSSRSWASGSAAAATRLSSGNARGGSPAVAAGSPGIDVAALRRRPHELPLPPEPDEDFTPQASPTPAAPVAPIPDANAFNESYFLMRLQEQVKDARRQGGEMCVAAVHVTIPGAQITPDIAETIAFEMARLASGQARIMSQPLALTDSEYVFSLPHTGPDETRQFVREIVRALGDYWCYFGIASFPHSAHDAQALVERARAACEASLQSGKRGQVEYSAA